jgi:hypothetical protein
MQPQMVMKTAFFRIRWNPMGFRFSARPRVVHQTSPNQTPIDKRRTKTIFNHFRDKPARFLRHCRITHLIRAYDFTPYQITAFTGWSMKSTFQQMGVQSSSNIDIYSHLEWKDYIDKLLVPLSEII